jgi:hypothetical protein
MFHGEVQLPSISRTLSNCKLKTTPARAVKITDKESAPIGIGLPNDWVNCGDIKCFQLISTWVNEEFKGQFLKGRIEMDHTVSFMIMDNSE